MSETDALFRQGIHGRRFDPTAPGAAHDIGELLVRDDQQDVGPGGFLIGARQTVIGAARLYVVSRMGCQEA
jgi:hypothetical protein